MRAISTTAGLELEGLFREHASRLRAYLERRLDRRFRARRDADDVLQEAYRKAVQRWHDFPACGMDPFPWLYRLVQDSIKDDHDFQTRRGRDQHQEERMPERSSAQLVNGLVSPLTSPSTAAARKELHDRVDRIFATLRPEDRDILAMHLHDQLSLKEIAQVLDLSHATVRQRYARARLRFRAFWKTAFGESEWSQ